MATTDRSLGRWISALEGGSREAAAQLDDAWRTAGRAHVIGVSGPPGAGKSVLVGRLVGRYLADGRAVGVLAVDPTSPLSGGAILADRLRMTVPRTAGRVFVRSLASRGSLGGLARVVPSAVRALECAGFDPVLIETVGVGQNEVDVATAADTVVLVQGPAGGDDIQGLKGGLLEVGDVLVANKCDLDGIDQTVAMLQEVARARRREGWQPPVVRVSARDGIGIDALQEAIEGHRRWARDSGHHADSARRRARAEILALAAQRLAETLAGNALDARVADGELTMTAALERLLERASPRQSNDGRKQAAGS